MSFKRRNIQIVSVGGSGSAPTPVSTEAAPTTLTGHRHVDLAPGVRPSAIDGRLTTSTGTLSLDESLAGHAGLPLGLSFLLQESTATDFGGVALRYFAAQGLVQGHYVHVLGVPESWKAGLPGLSTKQFSNTSSPVNSPKESDERMKIAWRYESFGNQQRVHNEAGRDNSLFCHKFDLSKQLESSAIKGQLFNYPIPISSGLSSLVSSIETKIIEAPTGTIHRIAVPNLLLPTIYPPSACRPSEVLQFLHALRALLRRHSGQTAAILTISADMFPSTTGLSKWIELLNDGVAHMVPTPSQIVNTSESTEHIQGYFRIARLPVYHEKGGGLKEGNFGESMSFKLSGTNGLVIAPLTLPPSMGMQPAESESHNSDKKDLDF